ncbi:hypothetical protein [Paracoccus xiamenensis]|uniref:hypothetical protein n=1 Tax=Paracoccus xiamenensis TaxID=2714901 RepID=UPI001F3F4F6B|nr:hypothetical protein [Paracoccus xiamenensis]
MSSSIFLALPAATLREFSHFKRSNPWEAGEGPGEAQFRGADSQLLRKRGLQEAEAPDKHDYQKYTGHIRTNWGAIDPTKIETHHIYELHRANTEHWRQANYIVQVMVVLMNHARLIGFLKKEHGNPAKGIPLFKQEGDGWVPWPDDVRAEFESLASPRARLVDE